MFEDRIAVLNKEETEMPQPYEKRIYTVDEIQDILGIGRNAAYTLVKSGGVPQRPHRGKYPHIEKEF